MDWLKRALVPTPSYCCPSPELSVEERRQSYADALLAAARDIDGVARLEEQDGWGVVRRFTLIRKRDKSVELVDGWARVLNPPILPEIGFGDVAIPDRRDFFLSIPSVRYVVEIDMGNDRKFAVMFYVGHVEKSNAMMAALLMSPVNGNRWRNFDYVSEIRMERSTGVPSCTDFLSRPISEYYRVYMRDLMKVSVLMSYFKYVGVKERIMYCFETGAGNRVCISIGCVAYDNGRYGALQAVVDLAETLQ